MLHLVQQVQRGEVARSGADCGIQPRHGFQVVVVDVGPGCHDDFRGARLAQEVGGQDFDRGAGSGVADRTNGGGKMRRATIRQVVPIHRGDDDMGQAESRDRIGNAGWFVRGKRRRLTGGDVAEGARAGACVTHDHHGGMTLRPALADVGTACFLADSD